MAWLNGSLFFAMVSYLPHGCVRPLLLSLLLGLDGSADFPARTLAIMTPKRDRIRLEFCPSTNSGGTETDSLAVADEAVLALARLIGRQMAREQFERTVRRQRRTRKKRAVNDDA